MERLSIRHYLLLFAFAVCGNVSVAQSIGGTTSGSASYCAGDNSGFVSVVGFNGTILHWESSEDLVIWNNIGNPTASQSYLDLLVTTHYRVIVQDGANPPDTSTVSTITIFVPAAGGTVQSGGTFCDETGPGTLTLAGSTGNVLYWQSSIDGGNTWTQIPNTTTTLNYANITQNIIYNAVVENVVGCPVDTAIQAEFLIDPLSEAGSIASDAIVCTGNNGATLTLSGNVGSIIDWLTSTDNGATWNSVGTTANTVDYLNLTQTTWYQAISESGVCPADSTAIVEITVVQPNPVDAGQDVDIINHESTVLNGVGVGAASWSPTTALDDPSSLTPTATPNQTTMYYITLTDSNNCVSIDSVLVTVEVPIPSAITPNEDGVNDFFEIDKIENLPENSLVIYNRQGNIVYEAAPYENQWDGRSNNGDVLPDGIYYYLLQLTPSDEPITGFVLIKR